MSRTSLRTVLLLSALPVFACDIPVAPGATPSDAGILRDGGSHAQFPDGSIIIVESPDGATIVEGPDGDVIVDKPDGDIVVESPDGAIIVETPDGGIVVESPDGAIIVEGPDASTERNPPDGSIQAEYPDASQPACSQTQTCVTCPPPFVLLPDVGYCGWPDLPDDCGPTGAVCPAPANGAGACTPQGTCTITCNAPWVPSNDETSCVSPNTPIACGADPMPCPMDPHGTPYCYVPPGSQDGMCYLECLPPYTPGPGGTCVDNQVTCGNSPQPCPDDPSNSGFPTCDPVTDLCTFSCPSPLVVATDNSGCVIPDVSPNGESSWLGFDQDNPTAMAWTDGTLYWAENDDPGALVSDALDAGMPVTLSSTLAEPALLATNGQELVWYESDTNAVATMPVAGGTPSTLVTVPETVQALAVDSTAVYWATTAGHIARRALTGGTTTTLATGLHNPSSLVVSGASLYFTDMQGGSGTNVSTNLGTVQSMTIMGAERTTLASQQQGPTSIQADSRNLYWCNEGTAGPAGNFGDFGAETGSIVQLPFGGNPMTLASGQGAPSIVAVGSSSIAWCSFGLFPGACSLVEIPIGGGMISTLIPNATSPGDILYTGSSITYSVPSGQATGVTEFNGYIVQFTPN